MSFSTRVVVIWSGLTRPPSSAPSIPCLSQRESSSFGPVLHVLLLQPPQFRVFLNTSRRHLVRSYTSSFFSPFNAGSFSTRVVVICSGVTRPPSSAPSIPCLSKRESSSFGPVLHVLILQPPQFRVFFNASRRHLVRSYTSSFFSPLNSVSFSTRVVVICTGLTRPTSSAPSIPCLSQRESSSFGPVLHVLLLQPPQFRVFLNASRRHLYRSYTSYFFSPLNSVSFSTRVVVIWSGLTRPPSSAPSIPCLSQHESSSFGPVLHVLLLQPPQYRVFLNASRRHLIRSYTSSFFCPLNYVSFSTRVVVIWSGLTRPPSPAPSIPCLSQHESSSFGPVLHVLLLQPPQFRVFLNASRRHLVRSYTSSFFSPLNSVSFSTRVVVICSGLTRPPSSAPSIPCLSQHESSSFGPVLHVLLLQPPQFRVFLNASRRHLVRSYTSSFFSPLNSVSFSTRVVVIWSGLTRPPSSPPSIPCLSQRESSSFYRSYTSSFFSPLNSVSFSTRVVVIWSGLTRPPSSAPSIPCLSQHESSSFGPVLHVLLLQPPKFRVFLNASRRHLFRCYTSSFFTPLNSVSFSTRVVVICTGLTRPPSSAPSIPCLSQHESSSFGPVLHVLLLQPPQFRVFLNTSRRHLVRSYTSSFFSPLNSVSFSTRVVVICTCLTRPPSSAPSIPCLSQRESSSFGPVLHVLLLLPPQLCVFLNTVLPFLCSSLSLRLPMEW